MKSLCNFTKNKTNTMKKLFNYFKPIGEDEIYFSKIFIAVILIAALITNLFPILTFLKNTL
jgi:hypothetical protein